MPGELLVPENQWRGVLGIAPPRRATRIKIGILNAVTSGAATNKGLHRWLHRQDVLDVLASEAERLDSVELRRLHARIEEATAPKE